MTGTPARTKDKSMSQIAQTVPAAVRGEGRLIGLICAAHFVSHYYILLLPPLFLFVKTDYGVSFTKVGLAITAFNVVSAVGQTPAGFLVDRISARWVLVGGLLLGAGAFTVAALVPSFWVLVAMFAVAGLGNTVYHPADYAILSHSVADDRMSHAFSVHTFSGMLGSAAAPASLLYLQSLFGWRGAFLGAAILGGAVALLLAVQRESVFARSRPMVRRPASTATAGPEGWRLLLSGPIVRNLFFFALLAVMNAGVQNYSVVALGALFATPLSIGNIALSGYLLLGALGVLVGGYLAARTPQHGLVATAGLIATGAVTALVGLVELDTALLIIAMSAIGLFSGLIMPSRDMIVREITPPGSFGKVFGFVTTGFNIGGVVSPLIFGALMDHGHPRAIFLLVAACCLVSIVTVATRRATI